MYSIRSGKCKDLRIVNSETFVSLTEGHHMLAKGEFVSLVNMTWAENTLFIKTSFRQTLQVSLTGEQWKQHSQHAVFLQWFLLFFPLISVIFISLCIKQIAKKNFFWHTFVPARIILWPHASCQHGGWVCPRHSGKTHTHPPTSSMKPKAHTLPVLVWAFVRVHVCASMWPCVNCSNADRPGFCSSGGWYCSTGLMKKGEGGGGTRG